jgi:hypothetical protein
MVCTWSQAVDGRVNFFRARETGASKEGTAVWRFLKRMFKLGLLAGAVYAVWRWFESQRSESDLSWEAQPAPYPPQPRTSGGPGNPSSAASTAPVTATEPAAAQAAPSGAGGAWVEPTGNTCPATHPVKANMSSRIFHVTGGLSYDRTHPDRCYRDAAAAEADGLRRAAR